MRDLSKVVDSILKQSVLPLEIIIVDQSDNESTKKYVASIKKKNKTKVKIIYLFQKEKSITHARNKGISLASGDIISFLDDDVILFSDYYEKIVHHFANNRQVAGLSGREVVKKKLKGWKWKMRRILLKAFLLDNFKGRMTISGFGCPMGREEFSSYFKVEMLPGSNMNFRKKFLRNMQFDEWFCGYGYREDADFSYRISRKAIVAMIPEARFYHNFSKLNRMAMNEQKAMEVKNLAYFYKKNARKNIFSDFLFLYSLSGLFIIILIEYLNNLNEEKYKQLSGFLNGFVQICRRCKK
jgi:glycosyltransferase involved in cell wall biosynthesis